MEDNKEKDVFLTVDFLLDSPLRYGVDQFYCNSSIIVKLLL